MGTFEDLGDRYICGCDPNDQHERDSTNLCWGHGDFLERLNALEAKALRGELISFADLRHLVNK